MIVFIPLLAALAAAPDASATRVNNVARTHVIIGAVGASDPDRIVCKRETVVGSRREKKLCFTRLEWTEREDAARRMMDTTLWGQGGEKGPISVR